MGLITFLETLMPHKEDKPNNYQHWKQDWYRIFDNVGEEGRHFDAHLFCYGFYHEVRAISDVCKCPKEDCSQ